MAGKNNDNGNVAVSDIGTIRNILMGQQMSEYKAEFEDIRKKMADDHADLTSKLQAQGKDADERFAKLEKDMSDRFDRLEKLLTDHVARLDAKLVDVSKSDKQDLGQMLAEISKKLTS